MDQFLASVGQPVEDTEEESFLLFTRPAPPAKNLGFIDSRASSVEVTLHGTDYTIQQSPTLLSSSRAGGTTGAVLWKITPLFAEWITSFSTNTLWTHPATPLSLSPSTSPSPSASASASASTVIELGCGIAGLLALALGPHVGYYLATDQEYVRKLFRENLEENKTLAYKAAAAGAGPKGTGKAKGKGRRSATPQKRSPGRSPAPVKGGGGAAAGASAGSNISFAPLDWELDAPELLKQSVGIPLTHIPDHHEGYEDKGFDLLLSCDCVYNEALVVPFVRACADICRLRPAYRPGSGSGTDGDKPVLNPTVCIIAQQQRSPDVLEAWLQETLKVFWVWRVDDAVLCDGLRAGSGYVVHLLLLK